MYVHLFHGRSDPAQTMEDWGEDGPIIGPVDVSWTYGFYRVDGSHMIQYEDMVYFNGMFYGDFHILDNENSFIKQTLEKGEVISPVQFESQLQLDLEEIKNWHGNRQFEHIP